MKLLLLITLLVLIIAAEGQQLYAEHYGDIRTCDKKYVKPGGDFDIRCRSDDAVLARVGLGGVKPATLNHKYLSPKFVDKILMNHNGDFSVRSGQENKSLQ